jgi:hypothetical protein
MIIYELRCDTGHGFEAWFRNSDAFEQQRDAEQVTCPVCGSCDVSKAPMAPRIGKGTSEKPEQPRTAGQPNSEQMRVVMSQIAELNKHIAETCDYVGKAFPEEARKIHYGEAEHREIYGEASPADAIALREEGISIAAVPWIRRTDS